MKERELADLLLQMGIDSGVGIEAAAEQLAGMTLPTYVNSRAFSAAVLEAVESQMRAQMEQRLQAMRQRFENPGGWTPATIVQPSAQEPPRLVTPTPTPEAAPVLSHDQDVMETIVADIPDDDTGSSDDTIVWSPRRD